MHRFGVGPVRNVREHSAAAIAAREGSSMVVARREREEML
jgi:hypothetical protein